VGVNLVMLGPPGAGKGTQAERYAREQGIPKISTGDILREAIQSGSALGKTVREVMNRGALVDDDLIVGIVKERLQRTDCQAGFVLDGFPRTVPQAQALDAIMQATGAPLVVVEMQVPDEELVRRMLARRVCADCGANAEATPGPALPKACRQPDACRAVGPRWVARSDDSEAVVRDRLRVYWRETRPMIAFYAGRPTFRTIDGTRTPDQVSVAIAGAVASALGSVSGSAATSRRGATA
jgi:adenylate kinase